METLEILKTKADCARLISYLDSLPEDAFIAYDTETVSTEHGTPVIGFSFAAEVDRAFYVVLSYWDTSSQKLVDLETKELAKDIVSRLNGRQLIMHNALFDCARTVENYGVELMPSVHTDTMILAHLLDENRACGLKELGAFLFGEDARQEQTEMKASVVTNGGCLTKDRYELYKADCDLLAKYGAKDALLTLKVFYELVPQLIEQGLDRFFYEEESMPLLRGPTYQLNSSGLSVNPQKIQTLQKELEAECMELRAYVEKEIFPHVKDKYPGTSKVKTFNIDAPKQLAWLLFVQLGNEFGRLTDAGREVCKALDMKLPYAPAAKRAFIREVTARKGEVYAAGAWNPKTKKMGRPKVIADWWHYTACGKGILTQLAPKYRWVEKFIEYKKSDKLLGTYVIGIQERMKYNTIRPSFLQHGTTSGRYSSRNPNFQNLPREDKRVKGCIEAGKGFIFVGADQSQLEPRVFASVSQDERLCKCFESGEDFYSVIGAPVFKKFHCGLTKKAPDSFAVQFPALRDKAKIIALATPYGRTASQMAEAMNISRDEAQEIIDDYFTAYPAVHKMMTDSHKMAMKDGVVYSLYGRPRRMPDAKLIGRRYGKLAHNELPYEARTPLNLAMNHRVQSSAASIMNRAAIEVCRRVDAAAEVDPRWAKVKIVLQVHDELILRGPEELAAEMCVLLKDCMENTVVLPGVKLEAEPKAAYCLADLK